MNKSQVTCLDFVLLFMFNPVNSPSTAKREDINIIATQHMKNTAHKITLAWSNINTIVLRPLTWPNMRRQQLWPLANIANRNKFVNLKVRTNYGLPFFPKSR